MKRSEEVRRILSLSVEELVRESAGQLKVLETLDEVYEFLADEMVKEFQKAAEGDRIVSFIMPVGPTQPYRIMAEKINYLNLNLKKMGLEGKKLGFYELWSGKELSSLKALSIAGNRFLLIGIKEIRQQSVPPHPAK